MRLAAADRLCACVQFERGGADVFLERCASHATSVVAVDSSSVPERAANLSLLELPWDLDFRSVPGWHHSLREASGRDETPRLVTLSFLRVSLKLDQQKSHLTTLAQPRETRRRSSIAGVVTYTPVVDDSRENDAVRLSLIHISEPTRPY